MKEETAKALLELGRAAAAQLGANPDECIIMVSRPNPVETGEANASCFRCLKFYYDESGCDPCPHCGASYFDQIFPGLNCRKRLPMIKRRRRAARRAALKRRVNQ